MRRALPVRLALLFALGCGRLGYDALGGDGAPPDAAVDTDGPPDAGAIADAGPDAGGGAAAVCSPDGWCWENPLPQGNSLQAVWGSGASDVWVVGRAGTILHWDGVGWSPIPSGTSAVLSAVWGSGADDAWAVGSD